MTEFIPQIKPWIDQTDLEAVSKVVNSTYVTEGEATKEFENKFKELTGATHAIAVSNGTVALYAALKSLGIGAGDEVIVPNITFIATANAVIMAGARPVLCEIEADYFCLDCRAAEKLVNSRTKAIIPVHLYGQPANMEEISKLAREYNLFVVEDAAQGVGVFLNQKHVGTFGEVGVLSFYGNKTITTAEGGLVLTDDDEIAQSVYRLKNHGRDTKGTFIHNTIGYNFAFSDLHAALGLSQFRKLDKIINRKLEILNFYENELQSLYPKIKFAKNFEGARPVHWFSSIFVENADKLSEYLMREKIQTRKFFFPLHKQPCFLDGEKVFNLKFDFHLSDKVYSSALSLPSWCEISSAQLKRVVNAIRGFYENRD